MKSDGSPGKGIGQHVACFGTQVTSMRKKLCKFKPGDIAMLREMSFRVLRVEPHETNHCVFYRRLN